MMLTRVFLILAVPVLLAAGGSDRTKLQGRWELMTISVKGKELKLSPKSASLFGKALTFRGDNSVVRSNEGEADEDVRYVLDESKTPKRIAIDKGAKGRELRGIYQVDGDTLRIALPLKMTDKDAVPAGFDAADAFVFTYQRVKK